MLTTPYLAKRNTESRVRTIIDLILVHRLGHLEAEFSARKVSLAFEVSLTAYGEDKYDKSIRVKGRSDWTIRYGDRRKKSDIRLLAVKTKGERATFIGMPQLIIYMTVVHQARRKSKKENTTIYGILSDGVNWWFAILTHQGKLHLTYRALVLFGEENLVLNYVDQILLHAIRSSEHTTLVKDDDKIIRYHNRFLRKTWNLGIDPADRKEEKEEQEEEDSHEEVTC